jgi:energy-coupling factor transporter ATP-binding protein EcfA2
MVSLDRLAKTLREAYRVCDVTPLEGQDIERYYVPLESRQDAVIGVNTILKNQQPGEFTCVLFTGHVGCGKSSELARIGRVQSEEYHVIYIRADEEIDVNDVEYTDLYLLIIKQVEYTLRLEKLKFDGELQKSFEDWFKDITEETEESVEKSVNVDAEASLGAEAPFLAKFLVKTMAQIKGGSKSKTTIRQTLEKDISRLQTDINLLLSDATKKLIGKYPKKKGFLLVLDGLDKCPPSVSTKLFFEYAAQMQGLNCTIIYTIPISALYSPRGVGGTFNNPHIVPMVNVYQFERKRLELIYEPNGLEAIASLIEKRVSIHDVFESRDWLLKLAESSSGHLRHLMQLMRDTCNHAIGKGYSKIKEENTSYAIKQLQFRFERAILREYYPELAQIAITKETTDDRVGQELLFSTAALEYNGNRRWVYPHSVIRQSEIFLRAVENAQSE